LLAAIATAAPRFLSRGKMRERNSKEPQKQTHYSAPPNNGPEARRRTSNSTSIERENRKKRTHSELSQLGEINKTNPLYPHKY
jgi:hypothetical protein